MRERAGARRTVRPRWPWVLPFVPALALAAQPARTDTAALRRRLDAVVASHRGTVGYAIHNLDTGERLERLGDRPFPTASLIKVPILVSLMQQVEAGTLSLADPVSWSKLDQVGGAGVLHLFRPGGTLALGDLAALMIATSDNSATNLVLDKVGIRQVWTDMEARGLPRTKVFAKVFKRATTSVAMDSSAAYGLGVSTPNEMARLFALIADGRAVSPAADSVMRAMLGENQDMEMLQRGAGGIPAAHKTGAVDQSRTECTLWPLRGRVVACVFTTGNADQSYLPDAEPHVTMGRLAAAIVAAWAPAPRAP
ncbi:MAG: serine hydrolase [Gemmatimonadota bacterium]|jgi:beta-lactamase class A|nr:class A beta-lactamase-related serine hydrolase [Gemmatimonadota bacterium]